MQTKVDVIAGFLGAGKTTLLLELLKDRANNEKIVICENEFGQVSLDSDWLKKDDNTVFEFKSGCICCDLGGDIVNSLDNIVNQIRPDRILIEPSGVARLSNFLTYLQSDLIKDRIIMDRLITVVDAAKYDICKRNFGPFYLDQISNADILVLSKSNLVNKEDITRIKEDLQKINRTALIEEFNKDSNDITKRVSNNNLYKPEYANGHTHDNIKFKSVKIDNISRLTENDLEKMLNKLNFSVSKILRAKGYVKNLEGKIFWFDYVDGLFSSKECEQDFKPVIQIIGLNLNENKLKKAFR